MTTPASPKTASASLRGKIFGASLKSEAVAIPELDTTVEVRGMSAGARGRVLNIARQEDNSMDFEKYFPALLIETVYDPETGTPLFSAADTDAINALPNRIVESISSVAQRLSGLGDAAKVLEKNSAPTTSAGTSSV
jgi:hypothetical protein